MNKLQRRRLESTGRLEEQLSSSNGCTEKSADAEDKKQPAILIFLIMRKDH